MTTLDPGTDDGDNNDALSVENHMYKLTNTYCSLLPLVKSEIDIPQAEIDIPDAEIGVPRAEIQVPPAEFGVPPAEFRLLVKGQT
jgi:hypothetical protein